MRIRGIGPGVRIELPSGETFVVPPEGIDVPAHLESEVRAALPHVFGVQAIAEASPKEAVTEKAAAPPPKKSEE